MKMLRRNRLMKTEPGKKDKKFKIFCPRSDVSAISKINGGDIKNL